MTAVEFVAGYLLAHPGPLIAYAICTLGGLTYAAALCLLKRDDPAPAPRMHEAPTLEMTRVHALPVWEPLNVPGPATSEVGTRINRAGDQLAVLEREMAGEES